MQAEEAGVAGTAALALSLSCTPKRGVPPRGVRSVPEEQDLP